MARQLSTLRKALNLRQAASYFPVTYSSRVSQSPREGLQDISSLVNCAQAQKLTAIPSSSVPGSHLCAQPSDKYCEHLAFSRANLDVGSMLSPTSSNIGIAEWRRSSSDVLYLFDEDDDGT
uniref:Uncharacterized protein n=1 Tax=Tetraselmis sp. GSL018 TaxID=582737 RepID=A0A061S657_9CHLO